MEQSKSDVDLGRFLSLVLRHQPAAAHITLDARGWAQVEDLLKGCARAGKRLDMETLERIVRENNKQRYSFNKDHTRIRANQGHSLAVDVELKTAVPPPFLYHGTAKRFLAEIREHGITRQSRQYVHLSADRQTAQTVGARHGAPLILAVDAAAMHREGYSFWLSENKVWLCREVPWKFITE